MDLYKDCFKNPLKSNKPIGLKLEKVEVGEKFLFSKTKPNRGKENMLREI